MCGGARRSRLPSKGRAPAYGLRTPFMSNVRPHNPPGHVPHRYGRIPSLPSPKSPTRRALDSSKCCAHGIFNKCRVFCILSGSGSRTLELGRRLVDFQSCGSGSNICNFCWDNFRHRTHAKSTRSVAGKSCCWRRRWFRGHTCLWSLSTNRLGISRHRRLTWFFWVTLGTPRMKNVRPNPSVNLTPCGSPRLAFISFWAKRGLPQGAGYLER